MVFVATIRLTALAAQWEALGILVGTALGVLAAVASWITGSAVVVLAAVAVACGLPRGRGGGGRPPAGCAR